jgi:hypothetical protein
MEDELMVLSDHYMDWKEANRDLVFAERLGKINAGLMAVADQQANIPDLGKNECAANTVE